MNMGNQIGGAVTASLTPMIAKHFGWVASFGVAAALCVVGALAWSFVNPERRLAVTPHQYDVPEPTLVARSEK